MLNYLLSLHKLFTMEEIRLSKTNKRLSSTVFKKGNYPANKKDVGHEYIEKRDGYTMIKTYQGYKYKHRVLYEKYYGNIPKGLIVIFKDNNKKNFNKDNLIAITKKENINRNSLNNYPTDLQFAIRRIANFNTIINKIQRNGNN